MSKKGLVAGLILAGIAALGGGLLLYSLSSSSAQARTLLTLSPVYTVDREYRSMKGPSSTQSLTFPKFEPAELLWIVGYRTEVVDAKGDSPVSQEFMCHSNLDFDADFHARLFELPVYHTNRLFTLSQGQQEIRFPKGFGLPFYSDEVLSLTTQVLNLNPTGIVHNVRHRVSLDYILDRDLDQPLKPLFMTSCWGLKLLEGDQGYFGVENPDPAQHGASCLPGEAAGPDVYRDDFRRTFSGHWVVKPGREVNRSLVTQILKLPYDTTVHYIAVHLHPFAESLELRDLTAGDTVYKSQARGLESKIGLKHVDSFSSEEGIPLYKDHEYELVSTYDNTTTVDQDSMAVMLLYLRDMKFKRRPRTFVSPVEIAHVEGSPRLADERLVLHTSHGEIRIGLYPDVAPKHVQQILTLARLGVYDTTMFFRVEPGFVIQTSYPHVRTGPPLTLEQQEALRPLAAEFTDLRQHRGVVSMALNDSVDPNSGEASLFILLADAPHLDQKFTIVGRVTGGYDTIERITHVALKGNSPVDPVVIEKAEVVTKDDTVAQRSRARQPASR